MKERQKTVKMRDLKQGDIFCMFSNVKEFVCYIVLEKHEDILKTLSVGTNRSGIEDLYLNNFYVFQPEKRLRDCLVYLANINKDGCVPVMEPIPEVKYVIRPLAKDTTNPLPITATSWENAKEIFKTKIVPLFEDTLELEEWIDDKYIKSIVGTNDILK